MKIIRQITTGIIVFSLAISPSVKRTSANPVILAPAAICAGTAGVGCVIIGTVVIGGTIYYIWQLSNGRKVRADAHGKVFRSDYLEDPEEEDQGSVHKLNAKSWQAAKRECAYLMGYSKKFRVFQKKGSWYCNDKGV